MAGLPDITSWEHSDDWSYQEVVFTEETQDAVNRVLGEIRKAEAAVWKMGAIPVFCTVAPMSLLKWNLRRLSQGRTNGLKHRHIYPFMQRYLVEATFMLNKCIHDLNSANGLRSPRIGEFVLKRKK